MNRGPRDFIANESGAVALIMAAAMTALLGVAALTVDYGYMSLVQNQLKNAAEAGALAGANAFGKNTPNSAAAQTAATNAATAVIQTNYWGNQKLTDFTLEPGYWSFASSKFTKTTATNATPPTETPPAVWAVRVVVEKNSNNNGGPLPLSFAPILPGISSTQDLNGTAVAVTKSTQTTWAVLETGNKQLYITGAAIASGSVGVASGGTLKMDGSGKVTGIGYLNTGAAKSITGGATITGGVQQDTSANTIVSAAATAATAAYNNFKAMTATTGTPTSISLSGVATKTITGAANATTVVKLTSFSVGNSGVLGR